MQEKIKILLELQKQDTILGKINSRINEIPLIIEEEKKLSGECENKVSQIKDDLKEIQKKIKEAELNIHSAKDFTAGHREKLNTLKSNEAYKKMQEEIVRKDEEISGEETKVLEFWEEADQKNIELEDAEKELELKLEDIKKSQNEFQQEISQLQKNKKEVEDSLIPVKDKLDKETLALYDKIKERKKNVLVKIENSTCGGCHAAIRPQKINEIMKEDAIVQCDNCSRFLYIEDESNAL